MSARVKFWFAGAIVGVATAAAVPESLFLGARPVILGSAFLIIGLLGELILPKLAAELRENRPADGLVELAHVKGCRGEPNPADPRFARFLDRDPIADQPVTRLPASVSRQSPPLLGRVLIVSLFVGGDRRSWSNQEIAEAHRTLIRAGEWLEAEAIRRLANVNLELADTYFVFDDETEDEVAIGFALEGNDVGPWEINATTKALVTATRAAASLGFHDAQDLFQAVAARVEADTLVWLLHPRRAGRSFAVPVEDSTLGGVSLAVCYPHEASFPEPLTGTARVDPVTVVHELLHLFGATDKYGRSLRDFAPGSVSSHEVMRLSETRLHRLRIDPSTAEEIGWGRNSPHA